MNALMRSGREKTVGVFFIVLAVLSGVLYYTNLQDQRAKFDCQANYNTAFAENLIIRSKLGQQQNDAVEGLLNGVTTLILQSADLEKKGSKADSPEQKALENLYIQTFSDYRVNMDAIKKARAENPIPEIPTC